MRNQLHLHTVNKSEIASPLSACEETIINKRYLTELNQGASKTGLRQEYFLFQCLFNYKSIISSWAQFPEWLERHIFDPTFDERERLENEDRAIVYCDLCPLVPCFRVMYAPILPISARSSNPSLQPIAKSSCYKLIQDILGSWGPLRPLKAKNIV